ncbi:P-loop NTPase fold protein [Pseudomonas frederiksbergensis]|uniref:KAP NTPase domain-containing protein n=1 Tax=Pseudomonas frederiksbergensis TaxID=104087 RepID=A0A423KQI1_9PSED|nr:P-loop NTPase fold protein [Pseudomonas frederiksbergensis]RON57428.1 hypothetical protein BK665_04810 [Pseudomonas frederiksbergensis]
MEYLKKSFDVFFKADPGVVVIRGDWGVGKTFFWDQYINERISQKNLEQIAYSYVSLFGKNSLLEIKSSVFQNAKAIATDDTIVSSFEEELRKAGTLYSKFPRVKGIWSFARTKSTWLGKLTDTAKRMPVLDKFSSLLSSIEYSLVNNYIICFDDIERKGSSLSIKELMGLADELAQRKYCKVVLIFNDKSFDKDGKDLEHFNSYREKVVDVELLYNPSCETNFSHVFASNMDGYDFLKSVILKINVKNVRVLRKLKNLLNVHSVFFKGKNKALSEEFLLHSAVLCASYYTGDSFIKYDALRTSLAGGTWAKYLSTSAEDLTPDEKSFKNINATLQMSESKFDVHIGDYLECGYVDENPLKLTIGTLEERYRVSSVDAKLKKAWKIYHDSFEDDSEEFKSSLKHILDNELDALALSDFSSAIEILKQLGEPVDLYTDAYITANYQNLKDEAISSSLSLDRVTDKHLREKVIEASKDGRSFTIDGIASKIGKSRTWNQEDIIYLSNLTVSDFVEWIHSKPDELTVKLRSGLLTFKNIATSNPEDSRNYSAISNTVEEALKIIAAENELNSIRVKNMYGISL